MVVGSLLLGGCLIEQPQVPTLKKGRRLPASSAPAQVRRCDNFLSSTSFDIADMLKKNLFERLKVTKRKDQQKKKMHPWSASLGHFCCF